MPVTIKVDIAAISMHMVRTKKARDHIFRPAMRVVEVI